MGVQREVMWVLMLGFSLAIAVVNGEASQNINEEWNVMLSD